MQRQEEGSGTVTFSCLGLAASCYNISFEYFLLFSSFLGFVDLNVVELTMMAPLH